MKKKFSEFREKKNCKQVIVNVSRLGVQNTTNKQLRFRTELDRFSIANTV